MKIIKKSGSSNVTNSALNTAILENLAATRAAFGDRVANVRDFGATGDGTTDDTAAIISASLSIRTTGGTLYFPRGIYRTRQCTVGELPWGADAYGNPQYGARPHFQIFPNTLVKGDGMDVTIIRRSDAPVTGPMVHFNQGNIVFEDFTIDGNCLVDNPLNAGDSELFDMKDDANMLWWYRVKMINSQDEAIDLDRALWTPQQWTSWVNSCVFENCRGNAIHNCNWMVVRDSVFRDCGNQRLSNNQDALSGSEGTSAIDTAGEKALITGCHFTRCSRMLDDYRNTGADTLGPARGRIFLTGLPLDGETITLASTVYTFRTTPTLARDIKIGADIAETIRRIVNTIIGTGDNNGTGTIKDPNVYAIGIPTSKLAGNGVVELVSRINGSAANAITLAESATNLTVSGSTLTGGGARSPEFVIIENCNIEDMRSTAVVFQQSGIIRNCRIRGPHMAVAGTSLIDGCDIELTNNYSTYSAVTTVGSVTNCNIVGGYINVLASDCYIAGNKVTSAGGGCSISGAAVNNVRVIGNRFVTSGNLVTGSAGTAAALDCSTTGQTGHIISGNECIGGNNNIRVQASSLVIGNKCSGAGFNGIVLTGTGNVCVANSVAQGILNTGNSNTIAHNIGSGLPINLYRTGTPEGTVSAVIGSTCVDTATGNIYRKTSGTGNTGWVTP